MERKIKAIIEKRFFDGDIIPKEKDVNEIFNCIDIVEKEDPATKVKIWFAVLDGELIGAVYVDPEFGVEDPEFMDNENAKMAFSDFEGWLNS